MQPSMQSPAPGQRLLSYLLLAAGVGLTLFSNDIGRGLGLSTAIVQFAALACLLAGAFLFYRVRERADRVTGYRQAFKPLEGPSDAPSPAAEDEASSKKE